METYVRGGQAEDAGLVEFLGRETDDGHQSGQLVDEEIELVSSHLLRQVAHGPV